MKGRDLFEVWAPIDSVWSRWAKPVLFADLHLLSPAPPPLEGSPAEPEVHRDVSGLADGATAVIVDLPGPESVLTGLALARQGFRPVPLFNSAFQWGALVDASPALRLLEQRAEELRGLTIRPDAPPAFLLDSRRLSGTEAPGAFDNRWMVFPQDFPSASFLLARHLRRAVVLRTQTDPSPSEDLVHVLLRWKEAGIEIFGHDPTGIGAPQPLPLARPSRFRQLWYRALVLSGLRRNSAGGFGSTVPMPPQSSGGSGFSGGFG